MSPTSENINVIERDKRFLRLDRIQGLMLSFCHRHIDIEANLYEMNDIEKRQMQRRIWTQAIVIIKMYSFTVAEILDDIVLGLRYIERERIKSRDDNLLKSEYEWMDKQLDFMSDNGKYAGEAMLKVGYSLQALKVKLSPEEIKAALSISNWDWNNHVQISKCKKINERDIINLLLVTSKGPKVLVYHAYEAALTRTFSDEKIRGKMKVSAGYLFKELLFND
ncbi:hypothetical protein [Paenibacillus sp. Leaf72]|uniref:hypothetical protein n=1 Tax=Paenibacillus sp. Leaf72 TaxID=1736234 RepID=UPI0006F4680A|nr:hypothetical protein [Paenibacillus sp. Leaf72]KQN96766.1 hypothetical protein ASF12_22085 [Paenibacillus sp. Leaf72]